MDCDAVLAVNTDESYNSSKFISEIERVSQSPIPLIGFIEKTGKIIQLLQTNCARVFFDADDHMRYCSEVAEKILSEITYARQGTILSEAQSDSRNGAP